MKDKRSKMFQQKSDNFSGKRVLVIDLERRLPDVDRYDAVPEDIDRYGRCAILRNGAFWFGEVNSSHPPTTQEGFYWAVSESTLFISPRGASYRWKEYVDEEFVRLLARKIGLQRYFTKFYIQEEEK
jgi:hypothetical protein